MAQTSNQPASWANAASSAEDAAWELRDLREEWLSAREEFVAKWTAKRDEYVAALEKIASLQRGYASWSVPFNLSDGKVQEKLDEVAAINIQELRDVVPDLQKIPDPIEAFDAEDAWWNCRVVGSVKPPKGYGRDYEDVRREERAQNET